jgi:hypothetical protein
METWTWSMHAPWTWICSITVAYRMDMQNGYAWWTKIMNKHHRHAVWTCSDRQHEHGYAAWTWTSIMAWTCSKDMNMQHDHGNAARTWKCSWEMDIQRRKWTYSVESGHAASTLTCSIVMDMQHAHRHASCTRTCSMHVDMRQGQGHEAWTRTYSRDMDLNIDMDTYRDTDIDTHTITNTYVPHSIPPSSRLRYRYHKKLSWFKHRCHKSAPALEDDQMMWRNLHYVTLNDLMLFNCWGLNKC